VRPPRTCGRCALLGEFARGAYRLEPFDAADVAAARAVIDRYADQEIALADASLAVLTGRRRDRDILTLDHRHFGVLRRPNGRPFRLVPTSEDFSRPACTP
jgi:hypothetical protein